MFGEVFVMYISFVQGVGLVVCGDDKGSLWLYNMPTMVQVLTDFEFDPLPHPIQ